MINTELSQLVDLGGTVVVAVMAFWAVVQVFKLKRKPNDQLEQINSKLNNHMTDYNAELRITNQRLSNIETDIKLIKNNLENIKISLKK